MKRIALVFCLCLIGFGFSSCEESGTVWMHKLATNSSDPWGVGADLTETTKRVDTFLKGEGVVVHEVEVRRLHAFPSCLDPECENGERVSARVDEANKLKMEKLGFDVI